MYIGAQVMVYLIVWLVEVCCRWHVGEETSEVVSKRAVCIGEKPWEVKSVFMFVWS